MQVGFLACCPYSMPNKILVQLKLSKRVIQCLHGNSLIKGHIKQNKTTNIFTYELKFLRHTLCYSQWIYVNSNYLKTERVLIGNLYIFWVHDKIQIVPFCINWNIVCPTEIKGGQHNCGKGHFNSNLV